MLWARQEAAIPSLAGFHRISSLSFPQPRSVWGGGLLASWRRSSRGSGSLRSCWHLLASAGCSDPPGPGAVQLGPLLDGTVAPSRTSSRLLALRVSPTFLAGLDAGTVRVSGASVARQPTGAVVRVPAELGA